LFLGIFLAISIFLSIILLILYYVLVKNLHLINVFIRGYNASTKIMKKNNARLNP
jgi:hypothetical protein